MPERPYSRVYHEIVGHPRFEKVYRNPHALGTWLQMLLVADAMYPMTPRMPPRNPTVRMLIQVGLVVEQPGSCYSMKGLFEERERRSESGRIGAAVRWHSDPNARRDETRRDETSTRAPAREETDVTNGSQSPATFMGFRPKPKRQWVPNMADIEKQHEEARRQATEAIRKRQQKGENK